MGMADHSQKKCLDAAENRAGPLPALRIYSGMIRRAARVALFSSPPGLEAVPHWGSKQAGQSFGDQFT
jgi:hypothetical protein